MEVEIKKINLWSAVKISFIIYAVLGFIIGIFYGLFIFSLGGLLGSLTDRDITPLTGMFSSFVGGFFFTILMGFFIAFIMAVVYGIIITTLFVWLYNWLSKWTGGFKVTLEKEVLTSSAPYPTEVGGTPV